MADKLRGYGGTEQTGTPLPLLNEVADAKMEALQAAGAHVLKTPAEIGETVQKVLA